MTERKLTLEYTMTEYEWKIFSDVMAEAGSINLTEDALYEAFVLLPNHIKYDLISNGISDAEVKEDLCDFLTEKE